MFTGMYTAIVTPFKADGSVDYQKLRDLVDMQAKAGVDGIVPVGTTGESPTLDFDEHKKVIDVVVQACRGRLTVIAGTGANCTAEALELTQHAKDVGADATLQVTPYYNKPNQEGLVRHFTAVAEVGLPVVLYNIPSRTGREIALETIAKLAEHPNIVGLKEAGGSAERVSAVLARCNITVLSGDDALTYPMMKLGAKGVISVAANIIPDRVTQLTRRALKGEWEAALKIHHDCSQLFTDLFIDTNPIPVKAAMAMMGLIEEVYRLPLCPMSDRLRERLRLTLEKYGLIS